MNFDSRPSSPLDVYIAERRSLTDSAETDSIILWFRNGASRRLRPLLRDPNQRPQNPRRAFQSLRCRLPLIEKHHLHIRPHPRPLGVLADIGDQTFGISEKILPERQHRALRA